MASIEDLPDEVLEYILGLLFPYKDLESCKCVSRRWYYLVKNVLAQSSLHLHRGVDDFRMQWRTHTASPFLPERDGRIAGRFSHSAVVHGDSMFIFGGGTFDSTNFNDLWRFDLSTRTYCRPMTTGCYPPPKACATFLSYQNKLILFGGCRHVHSATWLMRECALYNQLHVYDVATDKWSLISGGGQMGNPATTQDERSTLPSNEPPALARHSATIVGDEMIVFGGIHNSYNLTSTNDVWRLDLTTYQWQKQKVTSPGPSPRYGQAQVQLDDFNILIVGGSGGPNNIFRDAWLLTRPPASCGSSKPWTWKQVNIKASLKASPAPTGLIWCNPSCAVGDKLIVLGPTRANDFQLVRETSAQQQRMAVEAEAPRPRRPGLGLEEAQDFRRFAEQQQVVHMVQEFQAHVEEQRQRLDVEHENILRRMRRMQRRPVPRMAAFQDGLNNNNNHNVEAAVHDRERRRVQDAVNRLRQINQLRVQEQNLGPNLAPNLRPPEIERRVVAVERKPTVNRKSLMAVHVCDLSKVIVGEDDIDQQSVITWKDPPANLGCFPGAPENLMLCSLVLGKGELIMFGGLIRQYTDSGTGTPYDSSKVSNALHFLSVPKRII